VIKTKNATRTRIKETLNNLLNKGELIDNKDINEFLCDIETIIDSDKEYNGHANYETWCLSLWLNNDAQLYNRALMCDTVEQLKEFCEELLDLDSEFKSVSIIRDLINSALNEIDFYELFKSFEETKNEE